MLPDQLARPPLRHPQHPLQVLDGAAPAGRAHQVPRPSSLSAWIWSSLSATIRFSRVFSVSSSFNRRTSSAFIPPYLELGAYGKAARRHLSESLERVYELFPVVKERSRQVAGSMSGGEQQMVAIARALMTRPRLLMFDEPSLGLAPVVVSQVFDTILRLHAEGLTILLVEQNLKQALEMADRGYVVETGSISIEGAAADLLADPAIRSAYLGV
jgi:branched-chain amino acid transport system ATP-binding protein